MPNISQNLAEIEKYIGLDQDPDVIADFQSQDFTRYSNIELIHTNFADISRYQNYIEQKLDLILMDLGTSMYQLRNAERVFLLKRWTFRYAYEHIRRNSAKGLD